MLDRNELQDLKDIDFIVLVLKEKIDQITNKNHEIVLNGHFNEFNFIRQWIKKICDYKYKDFNAEYIHYKLTSKKYILKYLVSKTDPHHDQKFIVELRGGKSYEVKPVRLA